MLKVSMRSILSRTRLTYRTTDVSDGGLSYGGLFLSIFAL